MDKTDAGGSFESLFQRRAGGNRRSIKIATRRHFFPYLALAGVILFCLLIADGIFLLFKWPFTREKVIVSLERFSSSRVQVGSFHKDFFPSPGYVAQNVVFVREDGSQAIQLASVRVVRCRATWLALLTLTHRVSALGLDGLHVIIPAHVPQPMRLHTTAAIESTVAELSADGAVLDIQSRHGAGPPLCFAFPKLGIGNLAKSKAMTLRVMLHNPDPPADLDITATVGPFQTEKPGRIPLSGSFHLVNGDLSHYQVIGGILSSAGSFRGSLEHTEVQGRALIPNFTVTSSHHELGLSAEYASLVDGIHGDVSIQDATAHFLQSTVNAHGSIRSISGQSGKTLALDLTGRQARIEDLLRIFVKADRSPLYGGMVFRAHVTLPPGQEEFLRRVRLNGDFAIYRAQFSHAITQEKVDELSKRARGKDNKGQDVDGVVSELKGSAKVRDAQAFLSNTSFGVPGALAHGEGTFNLKSQQLNFQGTLAIQASLSKATGGMKSIFLFPLDPFFKRKYAGAIIPFRMTGTYSHPVFKISLTGRK